MVVGVMAALLTACATGTPSPPEASFVSEETPEVAAPSYQCTPAGDPSASYPCSKQAYDRQQQQASLEAEAVRVYQRFRAEYVRLSQSGGAQALSPELEAVLADPMKADVAMQLATQQREGRTVRGNVPQPEWVVDRGSSYDGSQIALRTCDDLRGTSEHRADGSKVSDGRFLVGVRYLKRIDGALRLFASTTEQEDSCPI